MSIFSFKGYSERSKARRALVQVYKIDQDKTQHYLRPHEGRWGFDIDSSDNTPVMLAEDTLSTGNNETAPVSINSPELAAHPVAVANRAGWPEIPLNMRPKEPEANNPASDAPVLDTAPTATVAVVEDVPPAPPAPDAFSNFAISQLTAPSNPQAPATDAPKPARSASTKGQKIDKERPIQNGVQQPSSGTLCRAVWDALTGMMTHDEATGLANVPGAQDIKAYGATMGWNANNVSIEYYRWRKFNGITGRNQKHI